LTELKNAGYTTTIIRRKKLFGEATLTKFRRGEGVGWDNLEQVCRLLNLQPGDILEYAPEQPADK